MPDPLPIAASPTGDRSPFGVRVGVEVRLRVDARVRIEVEVRVGVEVRVWVEVGVEVRVGVGVGVKMGFMVRHVNEDPTAKLRDRMVCMIARAGENLKIRPSFVVDFFRRNAGCCRLL